MKKIIVLAFASLMALLILVQCKSKEEKHVYVPLAAENPNLHKVIVKEILETPVYTYLFVSEGDKEYWMAIPSMAVEVGKSYTYENGMEMKNFESKELKRTFETVYFVEQLVDPSVPVASETTPEAISGQTTEKAKKVEGGVISAKLMSGVTLAKGAISLHDLFANKEKYAGKIVTVTGRVVSYNAEILKKNWIHLQDGSSFKGLNDVTITTLAQVKIGDIVTLKGTVVLNKDFGMGYKYEVLIEDATIVK